MREHSLRNTDLAKRLGASETGARRMLKPRHDIKPEKIQSALAPLRERSLVAIEYAAQIDLVRQSGRRRDSAKLTLFRLF